MFLWVSIFHIFKWTSVIKTFFRANILKWYSILSMYNVMYISFTMYRPLSHVLTYNYKRWSDLDRQLYAQAVIFGRVELFLWHIIYIAEFKAERNKTLFEKYIDLCIYPVWYRRFFTFVFAWCYHEATRRFCVFLSHKRLKHVLIPKIACYVRTRFLSLAECRSIYFKPHLLRDKKYSMNRLSYFDDKLVINDKIRG